MVYKKDFNLWNNVKKGLNTKNRRTFFYEKEIWWCSIGVNVGSEEDGKGNLSLRPVLVYKKINNHTFLGIPLTRILREDSTHVPFYFNYDLNSAIISQIKIFDTKRFFKVINRISDHVYLKIKEKVIAFIQ